MSADSDVIMEMVPPGQGRALDLGSGKGLLKDPLEKIGYSYIGIDLRDRDIRSLSFVKGDAQLLPFKNESFDILISKDTMEHFLDPWMVVREAHRVLRSGGHFVVWVPFLHPFHGNDYYRFSPLGLRRLLADFEILRFESPYGPLSVQGSLIAQVLKGARLKRAAGLCKRFFRSLDRFLLRGRTATSGFAAAYLILARKGIKGVSSDTETGLGA